VEEATGSKYLTAKEMKMARHMDSSDTDFDAKFLGWQKKHSGEIFPVFNITMAGHPLCYSTVSETTLRKLNLRIPQTRSPYPDTAQAPWSDLGVDLKHPRTAHEAIRMAGLDYPVVKYPISLHAGPNPEMFATMRTDTCEVLGFVHADYEPIQNTDAFTFFDTLVAGSEATYEIAGLLGRGERVWLLARLTGDINVHGNDIVNKYLLLINSHDGSAHVRVKVMPIRVVCNNTLTSALQGMGDIIVGGAPSTRMNPEQALTILTMSNSLYEQLDCVFNAMAAKSITDKQLQEYVRVLVPDKEGDTDTARTAVIRNHVLHLHEAGRGVNLARGTVWGAFNSVAEYTDHMMVEEDSSTRLNSVWFGRGEHLKVKAFRLAQRLMQA
jgi:phage/plasmid-like protein (TIGR03299 family)